MLKPLSRLTGSTITATDGDIGHVTEAYFDDEAWVIRYLVIDTGQWLPGREVLISPYSVRPRVAADPEAILAKHIDTSLTRQQVNDSPAIDTHRPVSRRHETEYARYYAHPSYWEGGDLWAMSALPLLPLSLPPPLPTRLETEVECATRDDNLAPEDSHLRSSADVTGHDIQALDDSIGHVHDFVFDDENWAIRYLVVDTRNWWPGGKKVLIATPWIDRIDWADKTVHAQLTREQIQNSPPYDEGTPIDRVHEQQLHDAHGRERYWE